MNYRQSDETRIATLADPLQRLVRALQADQVPFMVICGHRDRAGQEAAYNNGTSRARFGQSPHNFLPSRAVDLAPFAATSVDYNRLTLAEYNRLAAIVKSYAAALGIAITWGGDFSSFKDRPHFELTGWKAMPGSPT